MGLISKTDSHTLAYDFGFFFLLISGANNITRYILKGRKEVM
jgi:hypothetical protein